MLISCPFFSFPAFVRIFFRYIDTAPACLYNDVMKERKYKEDWVNETRFDDRGKEKRVPVYRGPVFGLAPDCDKKSLLLRALLPWLGCLILLVLFFWLDFPGTRILYVFLPAALALFPCFYWAVGLWALFRAPDRMTRLQKENSIGRILRSAVGCTVFSFAALPGEVIFLLSGGDASREYPGSLILLGAAILALGAANMFRTVHSRLSKEDNIQS